MALESSMISSQILQNATADGVVAIYTVLLQKIINLREEIRARNDTSDGQELLKNIITDIQSLRRELSTLDDSLNMVCARLSKL